MKISNEACQAFTFSVVGLQHFHIYGMTQGLLDAGARLKYVYDKDALALDQFIESFPEAIKVCNLEDILMDQETQLVASATIPSERSKLGMQVMTAGKDYFVDKAPFTSLEQITMVEECIRLTHQKYIVYYSEMVHVEGAVHAKQLVDSGEIGEVLQVMNLGPHRLNPSTRQAWFFDKDKTGGILCDIGCHNIYQFLEYTDSDTAKVVHSAIANYKHAKYPGLDDFGEANLVSSKGQTHYFRVDWFTPDGLGTWGDGRLLILGTEGYIEVRKYINAGVSKDIDNVLLVNGVEENFTSVTGKVGFPFFEAMIDDCRHRTDKAQNQKRAIEASRLAIIAQNQALILK